MGKRAMELAERFKAFNDEVIRFVEGLRDDDLDRKGHIAAVGGDMTAEQVVGIIMIQSGKEHLASAKSA
ncbi:hypothetical protein [Candidatus Deferrimicrobium sp.]|uniref:hypothetical protein n=1 Tax=Candidatus Deferrimicrobium sp. TaxID=3060586 RepID=UPI003C487FF1